MQDSPERRRRRAVRDIQVGWGPAPAPVAWRDPRHHRRMRSEKSHQDTGGRGFDSRHLHPIFATKVLIGALLWRAPIAPAQFPDHVLRARDVAVMHGVTSWVGADEDPAPLSGHRPAVGAVRGGAALVGELGGDPDLLQPIAQGSSGVGHKPAMRPAVVHRAGIFVSHPGRIADDHARCLGLFQEARSKARRPVGREGDNPPGAGLGARDVT